MKKSSFMRVFTMASMLCVASVVLTACGTAVPRLPEVFDLIADSDATQHMEMQAKRAIFCELRDAVQKARDRVEQRIYYQGKLVATERPLPDTWGVQMTLKFSVQETTKLAIGASYVWPLQRASETFALGSGGTLSSDALRTDTFYTFYTIGDLYTVLSERNVCSLPDQQYVGPRSSSSPFVLLSDLGIKDWLTASSRTNSYLKSSRKEANDVGPALGSVGSNAADSFSYNIKFVIVSSLNMTPSWKLVRLTTASSPALFDTNRTRTHELILTVGPGNYVQEKVGNRFVQRSTGPSLSASASHQALQIGSAVATSLRSLQP